MQKKIFNLIIQPTHMCNLKCRYCYDVNNHPLREKKFISFEYLEKMFNIIATKYTDIKCIWLGGEPLLYGLDSYNEIMRLQHKIKDLTGTNFYNSMETNGLLLTDDFCTFLKNNNFHIGISYDGERNELTRNIPADEIKKIFAKLKKNGVSFSCLYVLNSMNVDFLEKDYEFFRDNNINFKINDCFSEKTNDLILSSNQYADAMFKLFLKVYNEKIIRVSPFDEYVEMIHQNRARSCHFGSCLGKYLCIDVYGDIYPCGRYNRKLANIKNINNFDEIFNSPEFKSIIEDKIALQDRCRSCELFYFCGSGCCYRTQINKQFCDDFKLLFFKIKHFVETKK